MEALFIILIILSIVGYIISIGIIMIEECQTFIKTRKRIIVALLPLGIIALFIKYVFDRIKKLYDDAEY